MKKKILLIFLITGLIVSVSGITYSFFSSNAHLSTGDKKIAKFVFDAEIVDEISVDLIDLKPGDVIEYEFKVKNSSGNVLSDITIEYNMIISTYHFSPLNIELYNKDSELILSCDETYSRNESNELVCNSDIFELSHLEENEDSYKLVISFPIEYNDLVYSDLVDFINIGIKSWQKLD